MLEKLFGAKDENEEFQIDEENIMFEEEARKLQENTTLMAQTFAGCKLNVIQFAFQPDNCYEGDADCSVLVELEGEHPLDQDVEVKVNLYNALGIIILSAKEYIWMDGFNGYDTLKIDLSMNGKTLRVAKRAKIFAHYSY